MDCRRRIVYLTQASPPPSNPPSHPPPSAFVSHDIEGPADDMELYTRWIQIGAFSGVMRSHDRGMSGGGCANDSPFSCSIVEPWNVPPPNFEANRAALQARETLLPYIYNGHRAAFDGGVGLIRPMYYDWPEEDAAYAMTAAGSAPGAIVQYMFGPSVLFSPVTTPAPPMLGGAPGVASKTTWLPPSAAGWYDANSGAVTYPGAGGAMVTKNYTLAEIPLFYRGGDVIPYLPLKSLPGVGLAIRQVSFLGLKIVPGGSGAGSTVVYEDDGVSTDYLDGTAKYVKTTASYTATPTGVVVTVGAAVGNGYAGFPATRAYQVKLLNGRPLASVTLNGVAVPFDRFGAAAATGAVPTSSAHYYAVEPAVMGGAGPVVNVVGVPTNAPATIAMTFAPETAGASLDAGVYGAISRAVAAKLVTDADRSTPGSNSPAPANLSVLSSTGDALAFLAGADPAGWAAAVAAVPTLLSAAISELLTTDGKSPRVPYAVTLLTGAST